METLGFPSKVTGSLEGVCVNVTWSDLLRTLPKNTADCTWEERCREASEVAGGSLAAVGG